LTDKDVESATMNTTPRRPRRSRTRIGLMAAVVILVALAVAVVIVLNTRASGPVNSIERTAQDRCDAEVRNRLVAPAAATLSNTDVATSPLDPDAKDLFTLTQGPLSGIDHSRITVWSVTVAVDAPNEVGGSLHDRYDCRAYFVDGTLTDTLVLAGHDH